MATYKIIRFRKSGRNKILFTGKTLEFVRQWCNRENTHKKDNKSNVLWFDGYTEE